MGYEVTPRKNVLRQSPYQQPQAKPLEKIYDEEADDTFVLCSCDMATYRACMSWLPVGQIIARKGDADFLKNWKEAKRNSEQGAIREFVPQAVTKTTGMAIEVERRYIALNAKEYRELFGAPPKVRSTRYLTTASLPTENGKDKEQVFLFRWQPSPYRNFIVREFLQTEQATPLMQSENHLYSAQGDAVAKWSKSTNDSEWDCGKPMAMEIKAIGEHAKRLGVSTSLDHIGVGIGNGEPATANMANPNGTKASDDDEGSESDSSSAAAPSADERGGAMSGAPLLLSCASHKSLGKQSSGRGGGSSVAPTALRKSSAKRGPASTVASPAKPGADDSASACGEPSAMCGSDADRYMAVLDLEKTMVFGKLGVQAYHANNLLKKLMESDRTRSEGRRLKNHLRLYGLAESLQAANIAGLNRAELVHAVTELTQIVKLPIPVQLCLFKRFVQEEPTPAIGDMQQASAYLDLVWPWGLPGDGSVASLVKPKLGGLQVPFAEKYELFKRYYFDRFVSELVAEAVVTQACFFLRTMNQLGDKVSAALAEASIDQAQDEGDALAEFAVICNGVKALYEPAVLFRDSVGESFFEDLRALGRLSDEARPCLQCMALAIAESTSLGPRLAKITRCEASVLELRPIMLDTTTGLEEVSELTGREMLDKLCECLKHLPRVTCALDDILTIHLQEKLLKEVQRAFDNCKAAVVEGHVDVGALKVGAELFKEAVVVFPSEPEVAQQRQALVAMLSESERAGSVKYAESLLGEVVNGGRPVVDKKLADLKKLVDEASLQCEPGGAMHALIECSIGALIRIASDDFPDFSLDQYTALAADMLRFIPSVAAEVVDPLQALVDGRSMKASTDKLRMKCVTGEGDRDEDLNFSAVGKDDIDLATVVALITKLEAVKDSLEGNEVFKTAYDKMIVEMQRSQCLVNNIGGHIVKESIKGVGALQSKLNDLKGGLAGGINWLDGLETQKRTVWRSLYAYAQKTIMSEKAVAGMRKDLDAYGKVDLGP